MPAPLLTTYRVQLHAGFGFDDAAAIVDYLAELGVSHLYVSPVLQAAPGSKHGYDVVDFGQVNAELGGTPGYDRLCRALAERGLGQLLDVVANHMAITGPENAWWWDVLENGPSSRYALCFDVDWEPPEARLANKLLLPVLADHYGRALEAGDIRLHREDGHFVVRYRDLVLPAAPVALAGPLAAAAQRCGSDQLAFIADTLAGLPLPTATDQRSTRRRHRDKEVLREQLERLLAEDPDAAAAVDAIVAEINADPDALHAFLEGQNFRMAFWRAAGRDLGYRRFFDNNTLIGLHMEDDAVFADTHRLVLEWLREGRLDGLRIDHPDGLRDPEQYFRRLRKVAAESWIVAEKILAPGERLPPAWPVDGTTGYDFLNLVGGLFVDPAGEAPLTAFQAEFCGVRDAYAGVAHEAKHHVMEALFGSDVNRLTELMTRICETHRRFRDYTRHEIHEALQEVIACFPVYRTYVRPEAGHLADEDRRTVEAAISEAKRLKPDLDPALFDFMADLLTLRLRGPQEDELVMRLQQLTGPITAKGVEDTALYRYNRLACLNEVGGDPGRFFVTVEDFHEAMAESSARRPRSMLATSTHDTKRSEDVRARLALLSEAPHRWIEAVRAWAGHNARYRRDGAPDRDMEYLFYQTLVGAWPLDAERAVAYLTKAAREAKLSTSWIRPDQAYEKGLREFVEAVLSDGRFRAGLEAFVRPLVGPGRVNSLAQVLIKLCAPGVPDIYQGTELWDLSLVDPDNRRPVDFALRRRLLSGLQDSSPEEVLGRMDEGLPKLWLVRQALRLRRRRPEWFGPDADYRPLSVSGEHSARVVAFVRAGMAVAVAPRLVLGLNGQWGRTALELPAGRWLNHLTGERVAGGTAPLGRLLGRFPVALLSLEEAGR